MHQKGGIRHKMGTFREGELVMGKSKIEWCDCVWNVVTGCTSVSEGCRNCYAKRMSKRLVGRCGYPADEPFRVTLHPEGLDEPLRWRKPRRVFVCSMGDLFHEDVTFDYINKVFGVMALSPHHIFIILTKRPKRMMNYVQELDGDKSKYTGLPLFICEEVFWPGNLIYKTKHYPMSGFKFNRYRGEGDDIYWDGPGLPFSWPLRNVWLGVTTENQQAADERIPILLRIPAVVRFVSVEPLLDIVDLSKWLKEDSLNLINWVICGCESGPNRRQTEIEWIRILRDQCVSAGLAFFLKQMESGGKLVKMPELDGRMWAQAPE